MRTVSNEALKMTRPKKQHRPGGIHYVVLFGNGGQEIFQDDADKENFTELVAVARARCNAEIFAFCLTRRDARLVVKVTDVPVGRLVQRVATQYSRNNHAKYATAGYLFQHPYRAYLLEGTLHLPEIVRHVHRAPLEMGVTEDLDGYRWCSHRAYLGLESPDWLNQDPVRELLSVSPGERVAGVATEGDAAARALVSVDAAGAVLAAGGPALGAQTAGVPARSYRQFMDASPEGVAGFAPDDVPPRSQLPSDDHFFSWLRRHAGKPPATVTVDQVIQAVAKKMGVDRKRLLSTSRERRLTLTRALIGWHVTKNQIATLTEVSRQLGRDPSSVYTAYARYRAWRPQLFRDSLATILQYLEPDESSRDPATMKKH
jgi:putative transposase